MIVEMVQANLPGANEVLEEGVDGASPASARKTTGMVVRSSSLVVMAWRRVLDDRRCDMRVCLWNGVACCWTLEVDIVENARVPSRTAEAISSVVNIVADFMLKSCDRCVLYGSDTIKVFWLTK